MKQEKLTKKERETIIKLINDLLNSISPYSGKSRSDVWGYIGKVQANIEIITKYLNNDFISLGKEYCMKKVEILQSETKLIFKEIENRRPEKLKCEESLSKGVNLHDKY